MATNGVMREERPLGRSLFRKIGRWLKENKSLFKAYLIFVLFTVIAFAVILTPWCDQYILQPMNIMTASASAWIIRMLGTEVVAASTQIISNTGGVNIKEGCNAVYAIIIFLAGIFAFPTSIAKRVLGAVLGVVALTAVNLIRVVTLFYLSSSNKELFDEAHLYIWQFAIILIGGLLWLLWYDKVVNRKSHAPSL